MKGKCCGQRMQIVQDTLFFFVRKCWVCKKVYKQHKRLPAKIASCQTWPDLIERVKEYLKE